MKNEWFSTPVSLRICYKHINGYFFSVVNNLRKSVKILEKCRKIMRKNRKTNRKVERLWEK